MPLSDNNLPVSDEVRRRLLRELPVVVIGFDSSQRVMFWNTAAAKLTGFSESELIDAEDPFTLLFPDEQVRQEVIDHLFHTSDPSIQIEIPVTGCEGDEVVLALRSAESQALSQEGEEWFVGYDVTRWNEQRDDMERATSSAEKANEARAEFLAKMSHEIRTPLNGILGMTDLVLETPLNEEQAEHLKMVRFAAGSLLAIVNDILDFSKVEASGLNLHPRNFNLRDQLDRVLAVLKMRAKSQQKTFTIEVEDRVPEQVFADADRLGQVLVNLVGNAVKFTTEGGSIKVHVDVEVAMPDQVLLNIAVIDDGIGVEVETQSRIFEAFMQADNSVTRPFEGTGLGLTIAAQLVRLMGGWIGVESEPGEGSTFHFTTLCGLSARADELPPVGEDQELSPGLNDQEGEAGALKVLVAEDNLVNQKLLVALLEKQGHAVTTAETGVQVLNLLNSQQFDVILMDVQMPGMDGVETTKVIRSHEHSYVSHIPIVALTAHALRSDKKRCLDAGMDGYLSKPIDRQALYDLMDRIATLSK